MRHPNERDIIDAFADAVMHDPMRFCISKYRITDKKTGIAFWTGNGFLGAGVYEPTEQSFSLINKVRFWVWYRRLLNYQVAAFLSKAVS